MKKLFLIFSLVIASSSYASSLDGDSADADESHYELSKNKLNRERSVEKDHRFKSIAYSKVSYSNCAERKHNISCHFCRQKTTTIKKNTGKTLGQNYCQNLECRQVLCDKCLKDRKLRVDPCLVCQEKCCCSYQSCETDHKHCHTYIRTIKRHIQEQPKWVKKKKKLNNWKQPENEEQDLSAPRVINHVEQDDELLNQEGEGIIADDSSFKVTFCLNRDEAEELYDQLRQYLDNLK